MVTTEDASGAPAGPALGAGGAAAHQPGAGGGAAEHGEPRNDAAAGAVGAAGAGAQGAQDGAAAGDAAPRGRNSFEILWNFIGISFRGSVFLSVFQRFEVFFEVAVKSLASELLAEVQAREEMSGRERRSILEEVSSALREQRKLREEET